MEPDILKQIVLGAVPPGVAGVVLALLLARRPSAPGPEGVRAPDRNWRDVVMPPALAVVYVLTHALILGWPELAARRSIDTMPIVAVVGAVVGVLLALRRMRTGAKVAVVALALAACGWLSARTLLAGSTRPELAARLGILTGTVALGSLNVFGAECLVRRAGPRVGLAAAGLGLVGVAQVLALGFYSLTLGQVAGVGAAAMVGAFLALLARRGAAVAPGAMTVPVFVAVLSLFQGVLFGDSPRPFTMGLLAACAIPAGGMSCRLLPAGTRASRRAVVALLAVLVPLGAAMAVAAVEWSEGDHEDESSETVSQGIVLEVPSC